MLERRTSPRYPTSAPVVFRTASSREGEGACVDLGLAGLRLQATDAPPPGTELWIYLKLPGRQMLAPAVVVWTAEQGLAVTFRQEPRGLREYLELLEKQERRTAARAAVHARVRIRRQSNDTELLDTVNLSPGGLQFQSARRYGLGETVWVALHYDESAPPVEAQATIVCAEPLHHWDAYSYGVQFLG